MKISTRLEHTAIRWLVWRYQQHVLLRVVTKAYRSSAPAYPEAVVDLFDEYFIVTDVLPLLQKAVRTGEKVTPIQVARLWAMRISILPSSRQQHTLRMVPTAANFLGMMADELEYYPDLCERVQSLETPQLSHLGW